MYRYFIFLEYDGSGYHGWQIQPNASSVQETLERALTLILRHPVSITGAGRTDTGVHAAEMTAHFDTLTPLEPLEYWCEKLNRVTPLDIAIHRIVPVTESAHARFDAMWRRYEYRVGFCKSTFNRWFCCKLHGELDFEAMNSAAARLMDYSDFTSFSKLHTDVKTNHCTVRLAHWEERGNEWVFTIEADRFLRNMVRAIVGTLFEVGRGKLTLEGFCAVIESLDRQKAGSSAPAHGLTLVAVGYPPSIFLPIEKEHRPQDSPTLDGAK